MNETNKRKDYNNKKMTLDERSAYARGAKKVYQQIKTGQLKLTKSNPSEERQDEDQNFLASTNEPPRFSGPSVISNNNIQPNNDNDNSNTVPGNTHNGYKYIFYGFSFVILSSLLPIITYRDILYKKFMEPTPNLEGGREITTDELEKKVEEKLDKEPEYIEQTKNNNPQPFVINFKTLDPNKHYAGI